ncbi:putative membrane protein [Nocardia kruczakiae]|uniref:Membrane protein n=1 Tax=Nocardia kruczakiae TaxID=261477 RepID=A0ABU1XHV0_9NOCA|nr:YhgE/Pip domain-containing protein [Nocardia kruczakiae]MDR7170125.1 putative membrane protein [Nocardia kruczakiae]
MTAVRLALLEFRRFRAPMRRLVPVGLAMIPLLYGSLYLWSNWDPYGRTDRIPVAVVDQDQPAVANGQMIDAGKQFTRQLQASGAFAWNFVDADEALDGLRHGRYYFTITVPPDFSHKLATAQNPIPERATMGITLNDANNYIVGIVAQTAKTELQSQIDTAAHAAYATAIYGDLSQVKQQLQIASAGAHKLLDATVLAQQGSAALTQGITAAQTGAASITEGVQQLADAGTRADQAITAITNAGVATLPAATGTVANATSAAAQSLSLVRDATGIVSRTATDGSTALDQFAAAHPEFALDPLLGTARRNAQTLAQTATTANTTADQAQTSAQQAAAQASELQSSAGTVGQAVAGAAAPLQALTAASRTIGGGAAQIGAGLGALEAGSRTLQTGADQLNSGAADITRVVDGAVTKIPDTSPEQTAEAADVLGSPVGITMDNLHPAGVYGRGFAPFFFAIALWVVGLLAYLFIRPLNLRALAGRVGALTVAAAGWLPVALIAAAGGLLLYLVVQLGLGLDPLHPVWVGGLLILAAGAFVAIDHFLRVALGAIGEALSLALLIIQLTACGGLYPIETTPAPFRAIHPLIPMTYVVDGLRVGISGGLTGNLVRDLIVLAGFLVLFLGATTLVVRRQRVWSVNRLHPQIEA